MASSACGNGPEAVEIFGKQTIRAQFDCFRLEWRRRRALLLLTVATSSGLSTLAHIPTGDSTWWDWNWWNRAHDDLRFLLGIGFDDSLCLENLEENVEVASKNFRQILGSRECGRIAMRQLYWRDVSRPEGVGNGKEIETPSGREGVIFTLNESDLQLF